MLFLIPLFFLFYWYFLFIVCSVHLTACYQTINHLFFNLYIRVFKKLFLLIFESLSLVQTIVLDFFLTGYSFSNTSMLIFNLLPFPFWVTCPFLIFLSFILFSFHFPSFPPPPFPSFLSSSLPPFLLSFLCIYCSLFSLCLSSLFLSSFPPSPFSIHLYGFLSLSLAFLSSLPAACKPFSPLLPSPSSLLFPTASLLLFLPIFPSLSLHPLFLWSSLLFSFLSFSL